MLSTDVKHELKLEKGKHTYKFLVIDCNVFRPLKLVVIKLTTRQPKTTRKSLESHRWADFLMCQNLSLVD